MDPQRVCLQAPLEIWELDLELLSLGSALCTLDRSMATLGQGQFASPWSPRTPLTGLTPTSS